MNGRQKRKKEDEESKLSVNMLVVNPNMKGKTRKWFQSIYN